jgi:hypothetical protein
MASVLMAMEPDPVAFSLYPSNQLGLDRRTGGDWEEGGPCAALREHV